MLIAGSFSSWSSSPVTAIETFSISSVKFPIIIVCPLGGSNTALNHGIVEAANITLDKKNRQSLVDLADSLLQEDDHMNYEH